MNSNIPPLEIPENVEDKPEFWLGQIASIVSLERQKMLTKVQAYNGILKALQRSAQHQERRNFHIRKIAEALSRKEAHG